MRHYDKLIERVKEANTLGSIVELLLWDKDVIMPKNQLFYRQIELGILAGAKHKIITRKKYVEHMTESEHEDLNEDERANLREIKWEYERQSKVPKALIKKMASESAKAHELWVKSRNKNNYEVFKEQFQKLIDLAKQYAQAINPDKAAYDVLLEDYDKSFTQDEIHNIFEEVKKAIIPLVKDNYVQELPRIPDEIQTKFLNKILKHINYSFDDGRLDFSVHPFSAYHGRITTRYTDGCIDSIFSTLHEVGHATYDMNLPKENYATPMGSPCSITMHEAQARFWENIIGRSKEFWTPLFDELKQDYSLDLNLEQFTKIINTTKPGLIRVDADELTYTLHIIIRFEIEQELFNGTINLDNAQQAWNEKTKKYLNLEPKLVSEGILQDDHYGEGQFGYFPTYALGNIVAAQLYDAMNEEFDVMTDVNKGDFTRIQNWMKEKIHIHGKKYNTKELVKFATGKEFSPKPYIKYLKSKFEK